MTGAAAFYAEELCVADELAKRIAWFMGIASESRAIVSARPWSKNGLARVYIELWSQNNLPPIESLDKAFFDAADNEIYITQHRYGRQNRMALSDTPINRGGCGGFFSGAKTRAALAKLAEVFYG